MEFIRTMIDPGSQNKGYFFKDNFGGGWFVSSFRVGGIVLFILPLTNNIGCSLMSSLVIGLPDYVNDNDDKVFYSTLIIHFIFNTAIDLFAY